MGGGQRLRPVGTKDEIETRQRHRADGGLSIDRERDMDGPVGAGLAIFARAVERINDPPPLGVKPRGIVLFLFGKHGDVVTVRPPALQASELWGAVAGPPARVAP